MLNQAGERFLRLVIKILNKVWLIFVWLVFSLALYSLSFASLKWFLRYLESAENERLKKLYTESLNNFADQVVSAWVRSFISVSYLWENQ